VANRFHYQRNIPIKDAAILSNCPDHEVRRSWVRRILSHDGQGPGQGGIEAWLRLGEAVGLAREELLDQRLVLPGVRSAVESYVRLAREEPWPVAVASSLTELFAPDLMAERIRAFERYYPWVPAWGMDYFRARLVQARVDSDEGLELTLSGCTTRALQERAVAALEQKCGILWSMLDAIMAAYGAGPARGPSPVDDRPAEGRGGGPP
jgi:pyrroloquinoline-quinone synthase